MTRDPQTLLIAPAPAPDIPSPYRETLTTLQALDVVLGELAADLDRWEATIRWEALDATADLGGASSLELLSRLVTALVEELGARVATAAQDNPGV